MSAVAESFRFGRQHAQFAARLKALRRSEYDFLLGRCIDRATLARAEAIASRWRVHPHQVLIANGWLDAEVYYRALAHSCGAPFKAKLPAAEAAPAAAATPRQSLASGLLKERARAKGYILAPDRLRPNALREMLARLSPYHVSLASPSTVRGAICRHFAPTLARHAVEGLVLRRPEQSARTRIAFWQRLAFCFTTLALLAALALAPAATLWVVTAGLALLFVPLIGFDCLPPTACSCRSATTTDRDSRARAIASFQSTRCSCRSIARRICCPSWSGRCRGSTIRRRNSTSRSFSR